MPAELVAIARFVPIPSERDTVLAALEKVTIATQSEPGNLLVALHEGDDGDFMQIGKWESLDAWHAHADADSVRQLDTEVEGRLAQEREISWFRPRPVGNPERNAV
jgi:quinol monooxygenase YgiN